LAQYPVDLRQQAALVNLAAQRVVFSRIQQLFRQPGTDNQGAAHRGGRLKSPDARGNYASSQ